MQTLNSSPGALVTAWHLEFPKKAGRVFVLRRGLAAKWAAALVRERCPGQRYEFQR
jgi:hypothetical protein